MKLSSITFRPVVPFSQKNRSLGGGGWGGRIRAVEFERKNSC